MTRWQHWLMLVCAMVGPTLVRAEGTPTAAEVNFNRDVRPILSNTCYACHGPDEQQRQAELRLDTHEGSLAELPSGARAIVPGKLAESSLYQRITAADPSQRMPPPDAEKQLTPAQVETLRRWIESGAEWRGHWSFEAPTRPPLAKVEREAWPRNAIDHFVLERLEQEGLTPSPEADKRALIRRVTFDLTGLPPTPDEVEAFLLDNEPNAYDRLVDRLLDSQRYGEHMARFWLDAARYGDTHGLHLDNERSMWPYRDWVVRALNENLSFDKFTIWQIAGDLLPQPTLEQQIATGFNRCNVSTSEGGSIEEEFRVRYAIDRVETLGTVFLGLTVGCAVCHDHKYDPIAQREFYQLFAFYNSVADKAMDGNALLPPPAVKTPREGDKVKLDALTAQLREANQQLEAPLPAADAAQQAWATRERLRLQGRWQTLDAARHESRGGATLRKLADQSLLAEGENAASDVYQFEAATFQTAVTALRIEALVDDSLKDKGPGRAANGNFVLSEVEAEAAPLSDPSQAVPVRFVAAVADHYQKEGDYLPAKTIDGVVDGTNGWAVEGNNRHESRTLVLAPATPIGFDGGTVWRIKLRHESQFEQHAIGRVRLAVTGDPTLAATVLGPWHSVGPFSAADGDTAYATAFGPEQEIDLAKGYSAGAGQLNWTPQPSWADGQTLPLPGENCATYLYRTLTAPEARTMTVALGSDDAVKVWLNGAVVHDKKTQRPLKPGEETLTLSLPAGESRLLVKVVNYGGDGAFWFARSGEDAVSPSFEVGPALLAGDQRTPQQQKQLRDYFRARFSPEWQALRQRRDALQTEREEFQENIPSTLVMREANDVRETFVLVRGQYDKQGDKVQPGVPAALPPLDKVAKADRLALAQWLVDPVQPLTARVTVNRFWQQYFGAGLVRTSEDFGAQGEWPSHPALLDWLAVEFRESGWDVKRLHRSIVTSATYRQSSRVTPELLARDRENRLLARGPRFRLDAEMVRDNALFVSGLLVEEFGGRAVKPYQPSGLWEVVAYPTSTTANFVQDHGNALWRRSLYTFWKRTAAPPTMLIFDAPSRESCTVRRPRTNTPLQALALMNDTQFVEAARKLAERALLRQAVDDDDRLRWAFTTCTSRSPQREELAVLQNLLARQRARFSSDAAAAEQLAAAGEAPRDGTLAADELAAWTVVMNLLLNMDETITKG